MLIQRTEYHDEISRAFRFLPITVLIGARQVGKTSIMKSFPTKDYRDTLFLNGQDIDVAERFQSLATIEQYLSIYLNPEIEGLLLIDEFQFIQGISTMMKLLTDKYEKLHILCSGSSSLDILQNVEESLAGRVRIIEVLSLSFREYIKFKDPKLFQLYDAISDGKDATLTEPFQKLYNDYLVFGGLPRVTLADNSEDKIALLNDIYQTYLLNDVRRYVANEHFVGFGRLLRLLAAQTGNLVNVNELSRESGLTYVACEKYLYLLQSMYIIRFIEPYSTNKRKVIGKMNKVYFYDLGLRNIIYNNFNEIAFRTDNGALFENEIMLEHWRKRKAGDALCFYRTKTGVEVDFILYGPQRKVITECKYKRLIKPVSIVSLNNIAEEEGISDRYIANINLDAEYRNCRLIPGCLITKVL